MHRQEWLLFILLMAAIAGWFHGTGERTVCIVTPEIKRTIDAMTPTGLETSVLSDCDVIRVASESMFRTRG